MLVIAAIVKDPILKNSPTFRLLCVLFLCNIIDASCRLFFDYISELLGRQAYGQPGVVIIEVLSNGCWFCELFLLNFVAASHILGVYFTLTYRKATNLHANICALICIFWGFGSGGFILLVPGFGMKFNTVTYNFYEDLSLPFMQIHIRYNWGLQVVSIAALLLTDVAILVRLVKRSSSPENSSQNKTVITAKQTNTAVEVSTIQAPAPEPRRVRTRRHRMEVYIALNFIVLSACLICQTTIYNTVSGWDSDIARFLLAMAPAIRGSKCWVYCISGAYLRTAIKRLFVRR